MVCQRPNPFHEGIGLAHWHDSKPGLAGRRCAGRPLGRRSDGSDLEHLLRPIHRLQVGGGELRLILAEAESEWILLRLQESILRVGDGPGVERHRSTLRRHSGTIPRGAVRGF